MDVIKESIPTISVIMPVFNGEKYLVEAIDSILKQTFEDFEFLIINDGSTDKSDEIIRSYSDSRIVYLKNNGNKGLVYTLNYGISQAKGEFVARMDADDISSPERFEQQIEAFKNDPELGFCGTWAKIIGNNKQLMVETDSEKIRCRLFFSNQFIHSSIMFKKSTFLNTMISYESNDFPAEDYALWTKLSSEIKMINLPIFLLNYRVHQLQISTISSDRQAQKTYDLSSNMIEKMFNYEMNEEDKSSHLMLINKNRLFQNSSDFKSLEKWLLKLKSLNSHLNIFNTNTFQYIIDDQLSRRFIYQNYKNNNPFFLWQFYSFYTNCSFKLTIKFHLMLIAKCLIFYKRNKA